MDGAVNPASIATSISIGTSLLAGFFSMLVAMRSRSVAAERADRPVSVLFSIAYLLISLYVIATALISVWGVAYIGLVKAALLLTAAFSVVGIAIGLMRGLRSGRVTKPQSA
jgi:hypothetical protein